MQETLRDQNPPDCVNSIEYWNLLNKIDIVEVEAIEGDIVEVVNGVAFLLQTKDGYNNIVALRVYESDKNIVWTMLEFCKDLYSKYGIEYVRVEGKKGKYKFLERFFTKKMVVRDKSVKERDVYYCHLSLAYEKLYLKCDEFEFYYVQDVYLKTTDEKLKKTCFDKMYMHVNFAVETALKKRYGTLAANNIIRNDFDDMLSTCTLAIMSRYKKPKGYVSCIRYITFT